MLVFNLKLMSQLCKLRHLDHRFEPVLQRLISAPQLAIEGRLALCALVSQLPHIPFSVIALPNTLSLQDFSAFCQTVLGHSCISEGIELEDRARPFLQ